MSSGPAFSPDVKKKTPGFTHRHEFIILENINYCKVWMHLNSSCSHCPVHKLQKCVHRKIKYCVVPPHPQWTAGRFFMLYHQPWNLFYLLNTSSPNCSARLCENIAFLCGWILFLKLGNDDTKAFKLQKQSWYHALRTPLPSISPIGATTFTVFQNLSCKHKHKHTFLISGSGDTDCPLLFVLVSLSRIQYQPL